MSCQEKHRQQAEEWFFCLQLLPVESMEFIGTLEWGRDVIK